MPTESEVKIQRYNKIEREADKLGRIIGVRRLKLSEQLRLAGLTEDLRGSDEYKSADTGESMQLSHRAPMILAAAVCELDGNPVPFPRSRGELDAILDRLDAEGMEAAATALKRLADDAPAQPLDEAKNLPGTPSSA